jgi:hypothetical protein
VRPKCGRSGNFSGYPCGYSQLKVAVSLLFSEITNPWGQPKFELVGLSRTSPNLCKHG